MIVMMFSGTTAAWAAARQGGLALGEAARFELAITVR
jgi:hypothetical protein